MRLDAVSGWALVPVVAPVQVAFSTETSSFTVTVPSPNGYPLTVTVDGTTLTDVPLTVGVGPERYFTIRLPLSAGIHEAVVTVEDQTFTHTFNVVDPNARPLTPTGIYATPNGDGTCRVLSYWTGHEQFTFYPIDVRLDGVRHPGLPYGSHGSGYTDSPFIVGYPGSVPNGSEVSVTILGETQTATCQA